MITDEPQDVRPRQRLDDTTCPLHRFDIERREADGKFLSGQRFATQRVLREGSNVTPTRGVEPCQQLALRPSQVDQDRTRILSWLGDHPESTSTDVLGKCAPGSGIWIRQLKLYSQGTFGFGEVDEELHDGVPNTRIDGARSSQHATNGSSRDQARGAEIDDASPQRSSSPVADPEQHATVPVEEREILVCLDRQRHPVARQLGVKPPPLRARNSHNTGTQVRRMVRSVDPHDGLTAICLTHAGSRYSDGWKRNCRMRLQRTNINSGRSMTDQPLRRASA
jgi:hypothetical protein